LIELTRFQKVLAFFAHPDDETLAAGATISKMTRMGNEVHTAIPATGVYSRRNTLHKEALDAEFEQLQADCQSAMGILGIPPSRITLGDFPDNELDKHSRLELVHWLEEIVERVKPDLIMTHHRFCTNIDHRYCHEAAVIASRPGIDRHISLWCGEVTSSTGYLRPAQWEPNLYIKVSEEDIAKKIQAMQSYRGEARQDPHPRSSEVLRALAKVRGSEAGFMWAEAFMAQRMFG
jgi:LmbE family N-acetylglucosaminyl deacetylase